MLLTDESADNSTDEDDAEEAETDKKDEDGEGEAEKEEEKEGDEDGDDAKEEDEEEKDGNESIGSNDAAGTSSADREANDRTEMEREEEEDPSNLQLAWEILEMAKVCFQKKSDAVADDKPEERLKMELKLADIYQTLGELSIENETYVQSIDDLNNCLRRRMELLSEDDRTIAETHYQLGVSTVLCTHLPSLF